MNVKLLRAAVLMACATLLGCASSTPKPVDAKAISVDEKIAAAAESVRSSVRDIAKAEMASRPAAKVAPAKGPKDLQAKVNVQWSGTIHQLAEKIASLSKSYTILVRGKAPAVPVLVSFNKQGVSLYEILVDGSVQAGNRANVTVDASTKTIIVEYPA